MKTNRWVQVIIVVVNAGDFGFTPTTLTVAYNAPGRPAVYPLSCTGEPHYIYLPLVLRNN
jgi:hypothetical protein